jgi:hypothetical protein
MSEKPWYPHRQPPQFVSPGNPAIQGPDLNPAPWNRGNTLPGPNVVQQPIAWARRDNQLFRSDGTNQVWTWESPVFDLRPGLAASYGQIPSAEPINHEPALGQSVYLVVIIGTMGPAPGVPTAVPIAGVAGVSAAYWEDGNNLASENGELMRLTDVLDCTETLLSGGVSTAPPYGASAFQFTPCVTAIRYWRVSLRITVSGIAAIPDPYFIQGLLH